MTVGDLITDEAINIVFTNTNIGIITPRELIAKDLASINQGWAIGHTSMYCLRELGLVNAFSPQLTIIGQKYLEILNDQ